MYKTERQEYNKTTFSLKDKKLVINNMTSKPILALLIPENHSNLVEAIEQCPNDFQATITLLEQRDHLTAYAIVGLVNTEENIIIYVDDISRDTTECAADVLVNWAVNFSLNTAKAQEIYGIHRRMSAERVQKDENGFDSYQEADEETPDYLPKRYPANPEKSQPPGKLTEQNLEEILRKAKFFKPGGDAK